MDWGKKEMSSSQAETKKKVTAAPFNMFTNLFNQGVNWSHLLSELKPLIGKKGF